jgi:hypothetical protein
MTVDPTRPSSATKQGPRPAAGAVEAPTRARRRGRREPHSTPVQQVGHAAMDAPAVAAEDASLATLRWCRSRDCRRRATSGRLCCCCRCCCRSRRSRCSCLSPSPCPFPCLCRRCWCWGQEGEGPPEDMAVPTTVGVEAAAAEEGALLLRARSRTRRPVPGLPSCPARSPRVRGRCGRCGRRRMAVTA